MRWFVVHEAIRESGDIKRTGREIIIPLEIAESLVWDDPDEREIDLKLGSCDMLPDYFAKLVRDCGGIIQHA